MTTPTPKQAAELTDAQVMDIALKARRTMDSELERDYIQQVPASAIRNFVRTILTAQANDAKAQEDAIEEIGQVADTLDSLTFSMNMPISAELHLKCLREKIPELRDKLNAAIQGMQTGSVES